MGRDPADADGARIGNLNSSSHNFLRISRILTSLGELGFRRLGLGLGFARRPRLAIAPCLQWRHPAWHRTLLGMAPCLAWHSAWHGRYKAPFLAALRAEVGAG